MYALLEQDYSQIHLISDTTPLQGINGINRVEMYIGDSLIGTFTSSGYTPQPANKLLKDLAFILTATSVGNKYIFTITPSDILDALATEFSSGVYYFKLYYNTTIEESISNIGCLIDKKIQCCLAQYLNSVDTDCNLVSYENVVKTSAHLIAADAAIRMKDITNAICSYKDADCLGCSTC